MKFLLGPGGLELWYNLWKSIGDDHNAAFAIKSFFERNFDDYTFVY